MTGSTATPAVAHGRYTAPAGNRSHPIVTTNVIVHVGAGVIGLTVGLVPLLSRKGGAVHRRWGRRFGWLAAIVVATACLGVLMGSPPGALIAVALSAGYQLVGGIRALYLRGRVPNGWDAALAIAALMLVAWLLMTMGPGTASFTPVIGYSTLGYVATIALYDLSRHAWPLLWSRAIRPLDHGMKMTGVYFAMLSAGAGNLLRGLQPWSQVLPSMVGIVAMVVLAIVYFRKQRMTRVRAQQQVAPVGDAVV